MQLLKLKVKHVELNTRAEKEKAGGKDRNRVRQNRSFTVWLLWLYLVAAVFHVFVVTSANTPTLIREFIYTCWELLSLLHSPNSNICIYDNFTYFIKINGWEMYIHVCKQCLFTISKDI